MNPNEPQPDGDLGPPPKSLNRDQKAAWRDIAEQAFWATSSDRAAAELLACALGDVRKLRRELAKMPSVVKGSRGQVRHPKSYQLREAEDRAVRLLRELGLTPSSRTRVRVQPKKKGFDPAEEFFLTDRGR